jgi:hypothetical protein
MRNGWCQWQILTAGPILTWHGWASETEVESQRCRFWEARLGVRLRAPPSTLVLSAGLARGLQPKKLYLLGAIAACYREHWISTRAGIQDQIYVGADDNICVNFEFWNSLLELGCFAGSKLGPTILLFFRCFFSRSGLLECWIRSYVLCHWCVCSFRPGTPLYSPWTLDSSALTWSLTLPILEQQK